METSKTILLTLILLLIAGFAFYFFQSTDTIKKKDSTIASLEKDKTSLESAVNLLQSEREDVKLLLKNISDIKNSELRDPTWNELKMFLELDDTNKMRYNDSFDCSGFAIELFKRARNIGLRCGIAEVEYEKNTTGHMLNVFQTDKGLIFVDVTGNENGTGKDQIAYIKVGKHYGTIDLNGIKEERISCDVTCSQFAKGLTYAYHSDIFGYSYFSAFKQCTELYRSCSESYNEAVVDYNRRRSSYTYTEIQQWLENLRILEKEVASGSFYFISESEIVKDIEIYW